MATNPLELSALRLLREVRVERQDATVDLRASVKRSIRCRSASANRSEDTGSDRR